MSAAAEWQELHFTARKDQVEPLEDWLFAHGALSVTLEDEADQPLLEPGPGETPLWDAVRLTALFAGHEDLAPLLGEVPTELCTRAPAVPVPVADREWTRVWEDQFHPLQMGSACGFAPAGHPLPTLTRSIYCLTRVLPLVRVRTRPLPCVCARWMRIFRPGSASWITGAARAFSGLRRRAWARQRCWVSITTPRRSRRVGIMPSATRCRTLLFLLCSLRITWWQTGKLRPTG